MFIRIGLVELLVQHDGVNVDALQLRVDVLSAAGATHLGALDDRQLEVLQLAIVDAVQYIATIHVEVLRLRALVGVE